MLVREWKGDIVFLHQVAAGAAAKSYGVHVAKLAGLPLAVIQRAATLVQRLEGQSQNNNLTDMLPLFGSQQSEDKTYPSSDHVTVSEQLGEMLDTLEPDACSPREALKLLYDLKAEYDKSDN
jgi:DNA mismatch repair protein MutS